MPKRSRPVITGARACALFLMLALSTAASVQAQPLCRPESGCPVPELVQIDHIVTDLMCNYNIGAATVAVTRHGALVYSRGFGWSNSQRTTTIRPDALMRIASVSKPMTAAAIRDLISEGRITLGTRVFNLGHPGAPGLLNLAPFPSLGDPRLADITVQHLLQHTAGWNRDISGDMKFRDIQIAAAMGVASPPGRENVTRFVLGQPLDHTPGTTYAYSNIGYLVLGLIVEQERGLPLESVLHELMTSVGIQSSHHAAGRSFKADQDPREPFYDGPGSTANVFNPTGPLVNWPYGGWDHESSIGHAGQIATAEALARFATRFYVFGPSIGVRRPPHDSGTWRWNHTGSLPGTNSLIRQRGDGITFGVILNRRSTTLDYVGQLRAQLDAFFDSTQIQWPTAAAACCPGNANSDTSVDMGDITAILANWLADYTPGTGPGDANNDSVVDFNDITSVLANWLADCP